MQNETLKRTHKLKAQAIDKLGGMCVRCGFSDIRALQIDHIKADGATFRKRYKSQLALYYQVLKPTAKSFQLLCSNCNWIKRHENNEASQPGNRVALCHPLKPHYAKDKCKKCYNKKYIKTYQRKDRKPRSAGIT